jgi:hypothetical protein
VTDRAQKDLEDLQKELNPVEALTRKSELYDAFSKFFVVCTD